MTMIQVTGQKHLFWFSMKQFNLMKGSHPQQRGEGEYDYRLRIFTSWCGEGILRWERAVTPPCELRILTQDNWERAMYQELWSPKPKIPFKEFETPNTPVKRRQQVLNKQQEAKKLGLM